MEGSEIEQMWTATFRTGEARIDGETVWGTAMYVNEETGEVVFRRHARNIGISPGHNPPLPDPAADLVTSDDFRLVDLGD